MTPLPMPLGGGEFVIWRIDMEQYAANWDSGIGAFQFGGRWNSKGSHAVYASLDPSTAILERAVHTGFNALDNNRHILTSAIIHEPARIHVVEPDAVPNPHWLIPGATSAAQQAYGDALTADHPFVLIPSAISSRSWNIIFNPETTQGNYALRSQERFALDPRLNPPSNDTN